MKEFPEFEALMRPLLQFLSDGQVQPSEEIREVLARQFSVTEGMRQELLENGTPRWNNLVAWALHHLSRARLVNRPKKSKAAYGITQRGQDLLASGVAVDVKVCMKYPEWHRSKRERHLAEQPTSPSSIPEPERETRRMSSTPERISSQGTDQRNDPHVLGPPRQSEPVVPVRGLTNWSGTTNEVATVANSPDPAERTSEGVSPTNGISQGQTEKQELVAKRIDDWRRRLIDLSGRNRLIAYRPTKATTLEIAEPTLHELLGDPERAQPWDFFFPPEPADSESEETSAAADTVDELVVAHAGRPTRGANQIEVTEPSPKRIARILDNLAKRSNTEFQDKALRILYVAAGFLDWHDQQHGKDISSPLVLVPVELRRESTRHPYRLYILRDEEIVINPSLTEKLRRDSGLEVPDDWIWEDKPIGQELDEIRQAIQGSGWSVRDDAVLGLFSFQKYVMYRDLLDHEEMAAAHPAVRSLAQGTLATELQARAHDVPDEAGLDDAQDPAGTFSILDADASQRLCVEAAKRGRSFVMQGPPGTGKSQTIANVIAEAIGQGKRILFVSEKAAALDVVFRRLASRGLDEYCLMLHGEHAARREVVQALDRSLTTALKSRRGMRPDEIDRLANLRVLLNGSAELIHLPQPLLGGRSLRDVHEQLAGLHSAPSIPGGPQPTSLTGQAVLDEYQSVGEVLERLAERWYVSDPVFAWRGYDSDEFTADDRGRVLAILRRLADAFRELEHTAAAAATEIAWPTPGCLVEASEVAELTEHLAKGVVVEQHWLDQLAPDIGAAVTDAHEAYEQLTSGSTAFAAAFPARSADDFGEDLPGELGEAAKEVRRVCGWADGWGEEFEALDDSLGALERAPAVIGVLRERATEAGRLVGQPSGGLTAERADEIADLAELAFSADPRPEGQWLVRVGLTQARATLVEVEADLREYQSLRSRIFEHYTPDALELDAGPLRERFATQYTSVFSKLSGGYRADAKQIKAARKDGKLPASIQDDLSLIQAARDLAARIDAADGRMRTAFRSYAQGRDTDTKAVAAALDVAERVLELSAPDSDLRVLGEALAFGSWPTPGTAEAADRLRAAKQGLLDLQPGLQRFIAQPLQLDGRPLDELERELDAAKAAIAGVARVVTNLNTGAVRPAANFGEGVDRANTVDTVKRATETLDKNKARWQTILGGRFQAEATDWTELHEAADWLTTLKELTGGEVPDRLREWIKDAPAPWPTTPGVLRASVDQADRALNGLLGLFGSERADELHGFARTRQFTEVVGLSEGLAQTVDDLRDWTEWQAWRTRADRDGWRAFVDGLAEARVPDDQVVPAFRRAYWYQRLEAFYEDDPDLAEDLRGGAFQRWVDEFKQLDRELIRTGADRLIDRHEGGRTVHVSTQGSEVELLRREARKRRRHLPVRVLLSRIPRLLSELKPCLLMSPLTVSHFLAPDHRFDLVVFDEASQVPPQDAINCIYRGDQLIVAGDSKQLPPTPFFQVAELDELAPDEEDASTEEDMESVLDACESLLPSHPLTWHYRSRSEPLIAFSNRHLYDDKLVTFPSADVGSARMGVDFVHVPDGVYDRGKTATNRAEARVVAERVAHYLLDGSGRSVGVIAFNTAQAAAIAEELDLLMVQNPELEQHFRGDRLDAPFVKHLEAVQGDERDVIVFSVGYARDAAGKFTMNFGPLNKDGGQRRLNVAVTRAREKVEVVASVRAADFRVSEEASAGARLLRDYIRYAESGGRMAVAQEKAEEEEAEWPSPLEEAIAEALGELGFEAVPDVGVGKFRIDIGVRSRQHPDRFLLGIECDGHAYANTPTARDRERLRHEVLDDLGWGPIHRIWSLDWVRNRQGEIARLQEVLAAAEEREHNTDDEKPETDSPNALPDVPERVEREVPDLNDSGSASALPWTRTYERARLRRRNSGYEFHETVNRREQTDVLIELLEVEAPVSVDYAIRRLAETWGLGRAGHRVVAAGRQAIMQAARRKAVVVRDEFLWRPDQALAYVRVPDPGDPATRRDIDDIPPEEIDVAIARLRESSAGQTNEQLIASIARVFGFDRTGERIRAVISDRLKEQ